jgi:lipopolysaccharide exporter
VRDLGHRAFTAFLWAAASYAGGRLLVFVATLVLARILVPDEFGLVAFALAVIHYLEYLTDLGLGAALIYRSDAEDPRVSSTAFWIGICGGLVLFAVSWFIAPLLGEIGPDERVVPLFRVLALYFLFTALGKAHEYRLRRSLEFRKLFWPQFLGGLTKGVVSIVLAVEGSGAWSLIIGQLAGALCQSAALWSVHRWRPTFTISRRHVRPMLRFGLGIVAVGVLGQGARNFDYLVVGAKLGAVALGIYYLAFRLPELVILSGFQVANEVLFPFYARLREGAAEGAEELRRGYLETVRLGSMVAFPAAFAMAALAVPLVLTLYGEEWRSAAAPLALIAIWAGVASLASMPGAVLKALGRSWLLLATGIMQIAILFPALWVAADFSITAVAAAQVVAQTLCLALLGVVIGRILGIPWHATFTAGAPALALSALMAAALYPLGTALPPALAVAVGIPFGALVYFALLRRVMPDGLRRLLRPLRESAGRPMATHPSPEAATSDSARRRAVGAR